eukprot:1157557-Pelagomonas_calceolata.AAC.5
MELEHTQTDRSPKLQAGPNLPQQLSKHTVCSPSYEANSVPSPSGGAQQEAAALQQASSPPPLPLFLFMSLAKQTMVGH